MKDKLIEVIRGLFEADGRPAEIEPVDIALTAYLVLKGALANPVRGSGSTLGMALNVTERTVTTATDRLSAAGWIHKHSGKSRRQGNTYSVILEKLPMAQDIKRTVITAEAWTLAEQYMKAVPNNAKGKRRRFTKSERQRFAFALQTFLDRYTAGDAQLLRDLLNFALSHPKYATKAKRGPHELRRHFRKILEEFKSGTRARTAELAKPEAPPEPVDLNLHPWDAPPLPSKTGQTVFKLQGFTVIGDDGLRTLLSNGVALKESDGCMFFKRTPTQLTETRVTVMNAFGKWLVLDAATGRGISEVEKAA
jgi:DNA-binding MarR family transcriptional regulator